MTREEIVRWATDIWGYPNWTDIQVGRLQRLAEFAAKSEREEIAKMFDEPMRLVPFGRNDEGGCLMCGFTPKRAAEVIRKRSDHG